MTVDVFIFINVQRINLKVHWTYYEVTYFFNHYLMDNWTIQGTYLFERAHMSLILPLHENKRESWIQHQCWLKRFIFRNTVFKICFHSGVKYNNAFILAECIHGVINLSFNICGYLWSSRSSTHSYSLKVNYPDGPVFRTIKGSSVHYFEGLYLQIQMVQLSENPNSVSPWSFEPHQNILTRKHHST